jgi:serine/threonine protein kinase/Tol biopolymer transport system component
MTLATGTKLGRYEIRSKIGEGGMGEVYLAEDAQLRRLIALKILPGELSANQDRMRRFVQEAQAAAALNHPNVAHIYEIGEQEGVHFIAMEFVEGLTLREKIHRDRTELPKLLRYLQQVAEGLAKAHASGIVHRDLKPDNIMITAEGHAKILDFGLAKLIEQRPPTPSSEGSSEVATAVMPQHSIPGAVMGTVGYMSPEQAQGKTKDIDHRSDIFSFGCLLFEAATGRRAFEGKDTLDSLHNIVHAPTPVIKHINPTAPDELQRIVRRCLAKDPEKRYQSIKDVAIELDELRQELKQASDLHDSVHQTASDAIVTTSAQSGVNQTISGSSPGSSQIEQAQPTSSSRIILNELKRHRAGSIIVAIVVLVVAMTAAWFIWQKFAGGKPPAGAKQMKISRLVTGAGLIGNASISPDGKYVAYGLNKEAKVSLRVKQVSTGSDREIVPPIEDARLNGTGFSPDGELVYYTLSHRERSPLGALYQVPVIGGREPKKILDHLTSMISFAPDGKRFAFVRDYQKTGDSALMVTGLDGGEPIELVRRKGQDWVHGIPAWSPDGKVIVWVGGSDTGGPHYTLCEVPAEGGSQRAITSHRWHGAITRPIWLKDGSGLIVNGKDRPTSPNQIAHVSYPDGVVTRITNDLTEYGSTSFGLTDDSSTIVTIADEYSSRIWLASADSGEGNARKLTNGKSDGEAGLDLTPDGRVVYVTQTSDQMDIWIMNTDGTGQKQLTSNDEFEGGIRVSDDGRYIVFHASPVGGVPHIWRMNLDGSNLKQLTQGEFADFSPFCSPDGQWVVFGSWRSGNPRLWKVPIDGGEPVQITDLAVEGWMFLPGGKLIFGNYFDEQVSPPKQRAAFIPFDGGPLVKVFDFPPRASSVRMPDERTLLYIERNDDVDNIWTRPLDGGVPKQLTRFTSEYIFGYASARDGKQFAMARGTSSADIILIKDFR